MELGRFEAVGLPDQVPLTVTLVRRPFLTPSTVTRETRPPQEGILVSLTLAAVRIPRRAPRSAAETVFFQRKFGLGWAPPPRSYGSSERLGNQGSGLLPHWLLLEVYPPDDDE